MSSTNDLKAFYNLSRNANVPAHLEAMFTGYLKSDDCTEHTAAERANVFETFLTLLQLAHSMK